MPRFLWHLRKNVAICVTLVEFGQLASSWDSFSSPFWTFVSYTTRRSRIRDTQNSVRTELGPSELWLLVWDRL